MKHVRPRKGAPLGGSFSSILAGGYDGFLTRNGDGEASSDGVHFRNTERYGNATGSPLYQCQPRVFRDQTTILLGRSIQWFDRRTTKRMTYNSAPVDFGSLHRRQTLTGLSENKPLSENGFQYESAGQLVHVEMSESRAPVTNAAIGPLKPSPTLFVIDVATVPFPVSTPCLSTNVGAGSPYGSRFCHFALLGSSSDLISSETPYSVGKGPAPRTHIGASSPALTFDE